MLILRASGQFVPKTLPLSKMLPISMTFCGFVVFTNLSLQTNTVGTYQIIKTMTTPGIMIIQTYFYNRSFSIPVRCTLVRTVPSQSEEGDPMNLPSILCPSIHLVPLPLPDHHTIYLPPMRMIRCEDAEREKYLGKKESAMIAIRFWLQLDLNVFTKLNAYSQISINTDIISGLSKFFGILNVNPRTCLKESGQVQRYNEQSRGIMNKSRFLGEI